MAPTRRPRGEGHLRRDELLAAAEDMLRSGMTEADISVADVVSSVGVSQPVLYRFFDDKAALFTELYRRRFSDFGVRLSRAAAAGTTARDQLVRRGVAYVHLALEDPVAYRRLFMDPDGIASAVYAGRDADPDSPSSPFDDLVDNVGQYLRETERSSDDPNELAQIIWAAVHGLASLAITIETWDDRQLGHLAALAVSELLPAPE